jgi:hypothetical protein
MRWLGSREEGERFFGGSSPLDEISAGRLEEPGPPGPWAVDDVIFGRGTTRSAGTGRD